MQIRKKERRFIPQKGALAPEQIEKRGKVTAQPLPEREGEKEKTLDRRL